MNYKKLKSVTNSKTGDALRTISVVILFIGLIASIILLVQCFSNAGFNWLPFASCLLVLFGSIFICVLGRVIAKSADYIEAIYKNVNHDFDLDSIISMGVTFIPGDVVMIEEGEVQEQATVINVTCDASGYYHFCCKKSNGEVVDKYLKELKAVENQ